MTYHVGVYATPAGDSEEPVVELTVRGAHDVSRLAHLLSGGPIRIEQLTVGEELVRYLRRQRAGCAALDLLRRDGGPDLTAST